MKRILTRVRSASGVDYKIAVNCDSIQEFIPIYAWQILCYEVNIGDSVLALFGVTEAEWSPVETVEDMA